MAIADSFTIAPADEQVTAETIQCLASWYRQLVKSRLSPQTTPEYEIPEYWGSEGNFKLKSTRPHSSLSDQLVFAVLQDGKGGKSRSRLWPMDFDLNGDIRRDRIPQGPPVSHGQTMLPFPRFMGDITSLVVTTLPSEVDCLVQLQFPFIQAVLLDQLATSEAIADSPVCPSEQIHDFELEAQRYITWEAKTDLERTQNYFTTYIEDHYRLSLILIGSDSFGFVSLTEASTYNVFLDPERTSIVNPMRVPSHVWNAKNARKRYVNDKDIKFKFPIRKHSLFANSKMKAAHKIDQRERWPSLKPPWR